MVTKYKFGEDGSYFDPETKRTYYKDPQYQKAYDDEWARLEKLYKMRQEEQRRQSIENFQRLLARADALSRSLRASGIAPSPLPWEQKNKFDGSEDSEIERTPDEPYFYDLDDTYNVEGFRDQETGEIYHLDADGQRVSDPMITPRNWRHYLSTGIMQLGQEFNSNYILQRHPYDLAEYNYPDPETNKVFDEENGLYKRGLHGGTAQNSYWTGPVMQRKLMHKAGYIDGVKGDYGDWQPEIEKTWKRSFPVTRFLDSMEYYLGATNKKRTFEDDIPIYQTAPDAIGRNKLTPLFKYWDIHDFAPDHPTDLVDPATYQSQIFLDPYTGCLYRQDWDLNDYGGPKGTWYETTLSNLVDFWGRPTFITTGVQPLGETWGTDTALMDWKNGFPMTEQERQASREANSGIDLYEIGNIPWLMRKQYGFIRPNINSDLAKPSVREALGITGVVNPLWEIYVTPTYTYNDFDD